MVPYYHAKTLAEFPIFTLVPLMYTAITYFGIGMRPDFPSLAFYYAAIWLSTQCAISFGYCISSVFPDPSTAQMFGPIFMLFFMVVSGFYVNLSTMPLAMRLVSYVSPFRYSFEAIMMNEFDNDDRRKEGDYDILAELAIGINKWTCLLCLCIMILVLRITAFYSLRRLTGRFA